jgi:hypothetical protein
MTQLDDIEDKIDYNIKQNFLILEYFTKLLDSLEKIQPTESSMTN